VKLFGYFRFRGPAKLNIRDASRKFLNGSAGGTDMNVEGYERNVSPSIDRR
jgi:hypothetical protein